MSLCPDYYARRDRPLSIVLSSFSTFTLYVLAFHQSKDWPDITAVFPKIEQIDNTEIDTVANYLGKVSPVSYFTCKLFPFLQY